MPFFIRKQYGLGEQADAKEAALKEAMTYALRVCHDLETNQNYPLVITTENDTEKHEWVVKVYPFGAASKVEVKDNE